MLALRKPMRPNPQISATIVRTEFLYILLLLVVTAITTAIRVHLLSVPLERDEGEYAYIGQLILQGVTPFQEAYNMKMPGIYGIYALVMALLGKSIEGIHAGLLIANLATVFLLFLLGRRLFSPLAGCVAGASFATMSLSTSLLGPFAHAEHFVLPPVLLGLLILHDALVSRKRLGILLAGVLTGLGFVILQLDAPFIAFGLTYVLYFDRIEQGSSWRSVGARIILFGVGALAPFSLVCLTMLLDGVFGTFWFWTFQYALEYVTRVDLRTGFLYLHNTTSEVMKSLWVPWTFALIGMLSILGKRLSENTKFFGLTFFVFSFLATCPGFYFRQHYFILLLPAIALLCGVGVETFTFMFVGRCNQKIWWLAAVSLVLMVTLSPVLQERTILLKTPIAAVSRLIYSPNPFADSIEIARYIRERSSPDDRIAIVGSEPQIYFYSQRRSASGYLYTYPLMENHGFALNMQEEMIHQIEAASPRYLVFVNIPTSWLANAESERLILGWFNEYQRKHYKVVGVIDIISRETSEVRWDQEAEGYVPRSSCWLKVFERT
jgi:hypothetical protein